jgi:hypothetical protein
MRSDVHGQKPAWRFVSGSAKNLAAGVQEAKANCGVSDAHGGEKAAGPTSCHAGPQNRIAQPQFLGWRADPTAARRHEIDSPTLIVLRKRSSLASLHPKKNLCELTLYEVVCQVWTRTTNGSDPKSRGRTAYWDLGGPGGQPSGGPASRP